VVTVDDGGAGSRPRRRVACPRVTGVRAHIPAAAQAARWALSNNNCYFPGCPTPVVIETRPGMYRKNAMIAHVYGVAPNAPRFRGELDPDVRDSFTNLVLLCYGHHNEVDDPDSGEQLYPPDVLRHPPARHHDQRHHEQERQRVRHPRPGHPSTACIPINATRDFTDRQERGKAT
jgi:hypothetical protein